MGRRVLILSSEIEATCYIREHAIARMLQEGGHEVEILGYSPHGKVWPVLADDPHLSPKFWFTKSVTGLAGQRGLWEEYGAEADVIYAMKPRATSFGVGLWLQRQLKKPLMLDVDDNERGFISPSLYWEARILKSQWLLDPLSPLWFRAMDRRTHKADAITVTTHWLREIYGGEWIPHTRNSSEFSPEGPADRGGAEVGKKIVLFLGAVRPHKGLEQLVEAWRQLDPPDAELHIVGTPLESKHLAPLRKIALPSVRFEGPIPFGSVAPRLRGADLICLPQRDMPAAHGQLPTKLIEAMACGRAVLATRIGDLSHWLGDGVGELIEPENIEALRGALAELLANDAKREEYGRRGRQRFLEWASREAVGPKLCQLVDSL